MEREARKCLMDGSLSEIVIKDMPSTFYWGFFWGWGWGGQVFPVSIRARQEERELKTESKQTHK